MKAFARVATFSSLIWASAALADPVPPATTVTYTVPGTSSVYQVFGHSGSVGATNGPSTDAILSTFAAGSGNVFTFSATGLVSCCSNSPNIPPDGAAGNPMNVGGTNGLSGLIGDAAIPLVGVFTSETDPFGGAAPATLTYNTLTATGLSPLLNQVFYIGDGRSGYNNAAGLLLPFTAPNNATRLYIGGIDAFAFNGTTGWYADNLGSWQVAVTHVGATGLLPEPSTWAMMLLGFGCLGLRIRRSKARGRQTFASAA